MSSVLNKRWLFPVKLGVPAGLIVGINHAKPVIEHYDYLHYRLYNTVAKIVAVEVNHWALIFVAVMYAAWLAYLAGNKLNVKIRIACWSVITLAVAMSRIKYYELIYQIRQINSSFFEIAYSQSKGQLIAAGVILLLLIGYFIWKRAKTPKRETESVAVSSVDIFSIIRSLVRGVERQTWFFSTVFVLLVCVNLAAGILWTGAKVSSKSKPNVVIIMVDTLRADHVGCYGYSRNTTPNIDRFAKGSIRFSRAIANSSWTTASVSSFMSSQLPQTTLAVVRDGKICQALPDDERAGISPKCITIAEKLHDLGYVTAGITSNPQYSTRNNGEQGFDFFDESSMTKEITSPSVVSVARKWIADNENERFFLFSLLLDTHSPYRKHAGFDFDPDYKGKDANEIVINGQKNSSTTQHMRDLYDSGVAYSDHHVGLLLDELKKHGLYDKSLIVVMSDHGEEFRDHGQLFHGLTLYKELVNVPLMIKLPYQTQGRVVNGEFSLTDLFPTILQALNSDPAAIRPDGRAVDLSNVRELREQHVFGQTELKNAGLRSVQDSKYKYILRMYDSKERLYDLVNDPLEKRNIAAEQPKLTAAFKKMIMDKNATVCANVSLPDGPMKMSRQGKSNSAAVANKMRSLGYMQ